MNNIEDRLRQAFRADADTIRDVRSLTGYEPVVPLAKHRLSRVTRIVVPLAAAATVAAAAIAVAAVPKQQPTHPASGPSAAGLPRFVVLTGNPHASLPRFRYAIETKQVATGNVVSRLAQLPRDQVPAAISAFGAPGRFVVTARAQQTCATWLYQFRLTSTGHITDVRPLAVPKVAGFLDTTQLQPMGASSSGPIVAIATRSCHPTRSLRYKIHVINVATRKVTTWTLSGTAEQIGPAGLTASADGRLIGLVTPDGDRPGISKLTGWTVPADSPSGPIARHWHKVVDYQSQPEMRVALSPNGDTMITSELFTQPNGHAMLDVEQFSTKSGLGEPAPRVFKTFVYPLTFSLDHSGRYLMVGRGRNLKHGPLETFVLDLASKSQPALTKIPNLVTSTGVSIAW
jgi:hypothetical protein